MNADRVNLVLVARLRYLIVKVKKETFEVLEASLEKRLVITLANLTVATITIILN